MSANLFLYEVRKTFQRKVVWVSMLTLVSILIFLLVGAQVVRLQGAAEGADLSTLPSPLWPDGFVMALVSFLSPGAISGIVMIVVTAVLWTEGYRWRTIHFLVSRGISRMRLVVSISVALGIATVLIIVTGALAAGGTSALLTLSAGAPVVWADIDSLQALLSIGRLIIAVLPFASLTLLFGVVTKSTAGALGAGLAYLFAGESFLGMALGMVGLNKVILYLPGTLAGILGQYATLIMPGQTVESPLTALSAAMGCIAWTILFIRAAGALFQQQDLTD